MRRSRIADADPRVNWYFIRGAGLLAAALAMGCVFLDMDVDTSPEEDQAPATTNPTAEQLALEGDVSVSEFPEELEGLDGPARFCMEIGGKVLAVAPPEAGIRCDLGEQTIDLPAGDTDPNNDHALDTACEAMGGYVRGIYDDSQYPSYDAPACITAG